MDQSGVILPLRPGWGARFPTVCSLGTASVTVGRRIRSLRNGRPGGWRESGETDEQAVYRELMEETGLQRGSNFWVEPLRRSSGSGESGAMFYVGVFDKFFVS